MDKTTKLASTKPFAKKRYGRAEYALPLLVGLFFWLTRLGGGLENLSYDLLFLFKPREIPEGVVIVYMDEESTRELKQTPGKPWDRSLHARLLERLTQDQAKLVVFDVVFDLPGTPAANQDLKKAIKSNGRVVLAADLSSDTGLGYDKMSPLEPLGEFREATTNWGIALVDNQDAVVRQCATHRKQWPSLPWAALLATGAKAPPTNSLGFWLNYYGPRNTIRHVPYCQVTNQEKGYFRDQVVFVGGMDQFRTPYSRWGGAEIRGVEILATGYLNLKRDEALVHFSRAVELIILVACGLGLGVGMDNLKPKVASAVAGAGVLVVFSAVLVIHRWQHAWFSWMVVAGIQIPCALIWNFGVSFAKARPKPDLSPFLTSDGKRHIPNIPDHTLISRIGMGAYGEVWLARNTIGMFRAVKFIFRDRFSSPDPYNREFRGIEKYMPISLNHPWLVHVLHIGRNDSYFFYIMEAGDDEASGQRIDPATYAPRNMSRELGKRKKFTVDECVTLGLYLTTALDYLHSNGLIHRDIKPSNIIFVNDIPKLADVGLVTEIASEGKVLTYVGTQGYIPPEGPGAADGDLYSLGKVLYETGMGRGVLQYPDLPTSVVVGSGNPELLQLNEIILKACESAPKRRYQSAAEMRNALLELQQSLEGSRPQ